MKEIELPKFTDQRGNLSFLESEKIIPFEIKGIYLINIYDINDKYLFNKNEKTQFFFIALSGSFIFENKNSDNNLNTIFLKNAHKGLYVKNNTNFNLLNFAENTVMLIISSTEKFNIRRS